MSGDSNRPSRRQPVVIVTAPAILLILFYLFFLFAFILRGEVATLKLIRAVGVMTIMLLAPPLCSFFFLFGLHELNWSRTWVMHFWSSIIGVVAAYSCFFNGIALWGGDLYMPLINYGCLTLVGVIVGLGVSRRGYETSNRICQEEAREINTHKRDI